ncbi:aromatic amino acid transaminase [Sphingobium lignivorans]|uniref:Aromatic-amino-acid transaminase n=1 Tax=Sphingobium lignivorans TaxID=2735886 RepID=A0ABR6NGS9_9SPHN|nr:amino acid aminotransferase [Sphingobium lignivorans]MBB5986490.1 aromatic-amino-acid transaminase [Sphingobium lignivorans]
MTILLMPRKPAPADEGALFDGLTRQPADPLLGLTALFEADRRPDRLDLGVGVFRDEQGATPIMRSVKAAEGRLLERQDTKAYLGTEGDPLFVRYLADLVLGPERADDPRLTGIQTPGGTGALRLGAELLAGARPDATVWIGTPTWPNHAPIFRQAGLSVRMHRFFDPSRSDVDLDAMLADLANARPGDVVVLHGCCHNPTGVTLTAAQWALVVRFCSTRGLVPFVDLAYHGLGDGLEADVAPTLALLEAMPEALLAYSCDKNFGLYRDRVGALWVQGATPGSATLVRGHLQALARSMWSMPPDHGAAIVREILTESVLKEDWKAELETMRGRINGLRAALAALHPALAPIGRQRGMFALLPVTPANVAALRVDHGIYMADSGRINIAGLRTASIDRFVKQLGPFLPAL